MEYKDYKILTIAGPKKISGKDKYSITVEGQEGIWELWDDSGRGSYIEAGMTVNAALNPGPNNYGRAGYFNLSKNWKPNQAAAAGGGPQKGSSDSMIIARAHARLCAAQMVGIKGGDIDQESEKHLEWILG